MEKNLEQACAEVDHDLSAEWTLLSASLRRSAEALKAKAFSTGLAEEAEAVSREANRLCDHVERMHGDVEELLARLDERLAPGIPDFTTPDHRTNPDEEQEEAIKIQREAHEMRADFKDVLKALFMWRDDPAERVKEKH